MVKTCARLKLLCFRLLADRDCRLARRPHLFVAIPRAPLHDRTLIAPASCEQVARVDSPPLLPRSFAFREPSHDHSFVENTRLDQVATSLRSKLDGLSRAVSTGGGCGLPPVCHTRPFRSMLSCFSSPGRARAWSSATPPAAMVDRQPVMSIVQTSPARLVSYAKPRRVVELRVLGSWACPEETIATTASVAKCLQAAQYHQRSASFKAEVFRLHYYAIPAFTLLRSYRCSGANPPKRQKF